LSFEECIFTLHHNYSLDLYIWCKCNVNSFCSL